MDDLHDTRPPSADILVFRRRDDAPSTTGANNPIGRFPIQRRKTFIYDVTTMPQGYGVTFDGKVLTRHQTRDEAVENARRIAGNMWTNGIPSVVRVIGEDGTISPHSAFG